MASCALKSNAKIEIFLPFAKIFSKILFFNNHTHINSYSLQHDKQLAKAIISLDISLPKEQFHMLNNINKNSLFTIGIHPWNCDVVNIDSFFSFIKEHAQSIIGIGECGLDRYAKAEMPEQETIFIKHAELSETLKKPLIIHCVKAFNELLRIHKDFSPKMPWIVHGFNRNPEIAELLLNRNMILSIGAILLDNRQSIVDMMNMIPDKQLVLETDISTVSISEIYKAASKAKQMTLEDLTFSIEHTIHSIYGHI